MRIVTIGFGGPGQQGLITWGFGPLITQVVRIVRGGRTVVRDIYGDKLEEFKIAAMLVAINGKDLLQPIINKRKYTVNEELETQVSALPKSVKKRERNIFKGHTKLRRHQDLYRY